MDTSKSKPVFLKRKLSVDGKLPPSIPLVRVGHHNECIEGVKLPLQIVPESIEFLRSIDKPVAPVAICGPYRTGKSYFLSRILDDLECFKVGHSTETCTRGIWMATSILECDDFVIVFLDTEGISALDGSMQASIDFLITTTLTSSMLIYNTKKPLQLKDIEKLRWCVTMSKHLHNISSEYQPQMPHFLWLLRDMDLNIGTSSPTKWLLQKLQGPRCKEITEALISSFSSIECIFLPPPAVKNEVLQDIIHRKNELTPHFNQEIEKAKNKILSIVEPKHCKCGPFTGFSIASLIEECVAKINHHSNIPSLEATWKIAIEVQLHQYVSKLAAEYECDMESALTGILPIEQGSFDSCDTSTLMGIHKQFLDKKCSLLESKLVSLIPVKGVREGFWENVYRNFVSKIVDKDANGHIKGGKLAVFQHENYKTSSELCLKTYNRLYEDIVASKMRLAFAEGIPHDITPEIAEFEEKYNSIACGPAKSEVFSKGRVQSHVEEIKLQQIPGHVEKLTVIGISSDRIKLTWCKPSVNPDVAKCYEVYISSEDGRLLLTETTQYCYALLKNLESNKQYTFVVRARNDQFLGSYVSHVSAQTTLTTLARSTVGIGTFFALTVGSPVAFPTMFSVGTISSIRSDIHEKKYVAAAAKGAALTLLPVALPFGVLGTIGIAPMIAVDTFTSRGPRGDISSSLPDNGEN